MGRGVTSLCRLSSVCLLQRAFTHLTAFPFSRSLCLPLTVLLSILGWGCQSRPKGASPQSKSGQRAHSLLSCHLRISGHLHTSCW